LANPKPLLVDVSLVHDELLAVDSFLDDADDDVDALRDELALLPPTLMWLLVALLLLLRGVGGLMGAHSAPSLRRSVK
jgi:hypothetical protein